MSHLGSLMKTTLVFAEPIQINSDSLRLNTTDGGETHSVYFQSKKN